MSSGVQGGQVSASAAALNIAKIINVLDNSFGLVIQWEKAYHRQRRPEKGYPPHSPATDSNHGNRSPTSKEGQSLCTRGEATANQLLSTEAPERLAEDFARTSLREIRDAAIRLNEYTNTMHMQFRDLRIEVYTRNYAKSLRSEKRFSLLVFRANSARIVKACEADLSNIGNGIREVEESLNVMTRVWHRIANDANYLLGVGNSSLAIKQNPLILQEIRDSFATLGDYFDEYSDKIYRVYDQNIGKLSEKSREQLKEARWRGVVKLEPPPQVLQIPGN